MSLNDFGPTNLFNPIAPINPGQTMNIFDSGHLTQIQHKRSGVDIVDHFDHGPGPVKAHIIHHVDSFGNITTDIV